MYVKQAVLALCLIVPPSVLLTFTAQAQERIDRVIGESAKFGPSECTAEVRQCQDGSFVSRDPSNGCEFFPCPEVCVNPITGDPDVPVLCFANPCEVSSCEADPDASCAPNYCGGCHAIYTDAEGQPAQCDPVVCTADVRQCPDGSFVSRDPSNGCEFFPCLGVCTDDVRQCLDGSFVSRDPSNGCEFFPCPEVCINPITGDPDVPVLCFANPCEVSSCEADPDASCAPNYCGGCYAIYTDAEGQPALCDPVVCTADVRQCPDGSFVSRDPSNGCEFFPCLGVCTADVRQCLDGSFVSRDPSNGCEFLPCPEVCINPITGNPDFPVLCLANPCEVSSCEADPDASCAPNFCGGCHAIYTDAEGQPALCEPVPEPSSLALQFFAVATLAGIGRARRRRG